jgi:hypothetical protein
VDVVEVDDLGGMGLPAIIGSMPMDRADPPRNRCPVERVIGIVHHAASASGS